MATNILTTSESVAPTGLLQTKFAQRLLKKARANTVYISLVSNPSDGVIPEMDGKTIRWTHFKNMAAGSALSEGIRPDASYISTGYKEATLLQYGDWVQPSDVLASTSLYDIVNAAVDALGYGAALTVDTIIRNECIHGAPEGTTNAYISTSFYARNAQFGYYVFSGAEPVEPAWNSYNGSPNAFISAFSTAHANITNSNCAINVGKLQAAKLALRQRDVEPFEDGYYRIMMHPIQTHLIKRDPEFREWKRYIDGKMAFMKGEIGEIDGVRIIESTRAFSQAVMSASASITAYASTLVGRAALATVDHGGSKAGSSAMNGVNNVKIIIKPFGSSGVTDALDQVMSVGYKLYTTAKVIDSDRGLNLLTFYSSSTDRK